MTTVSLSDQLAKDDNGLVLRGCLFRDAMRHEVVGHGLDLLPHLVREKRYRPTDNVGVNLLAFGDCGGTGLVIAASEIYSVGVDAGPIGSTKRDREAPGANGSPKYCVSWATLPSLNSMMLTV